MQSLLSCQLKAWACGRVGRVYHTYTSLLFSLSLASFILLIPFPFMYYTFFFINLFNYSGTLCLSFPICPPPLLLHPSCCSSCICWDIWPVVLVLHVLFPVDVICSLCQAWSQCCLQDANIMTLSLALDIPCLA